MDQKLSFKSGVVAVIGRPNVGKSTLINALVGQDLTIASAHPHTTRRQIRAIYNDSHHQIVFVDTPGIHKPSHALSEKMNEHAYDALSGVDIVIFVLDAAAGIGKGDLYIAEKLQNVDNVVIALNKCDVINDPAKIAAALSQVSDMMDKETEIFPLSSFTSKNVHLLKEKLLSELEEGPALFDTTSRSDMTDEQIIAEMYREQLLHKLKQELPQSVAVIAQEEEHDSSKRYFSVKVIVNKSSHKPIIIGKNGIMLEEVGTKARKRIEKILGEPLILKAKVVVDENWHSKGDNIDSYYF